ncbi:MAG: hypothetical protein WD751_08330 [Anaerolineales bacterium]
MSFRNLALAVLFLSVFFMGLRFSMDTDTWWQLRTGELIAEQGAIPTQDSFSFTRTGEAWRYPSGAWLSELQLFEIHAVFGPGGLNIWVAAMVTLTFIFIYMAMSGPPLLRAFIIVLAATAAGIYWAARPYMLSFVLSAVFLWILEDYRWRRKNRLVWLLPLMIFWANSHPGFATGFLLLAIYGVDEALRWALALWHGPRKEAIKSRQRLGAMLLLVVGMIAATSINPAGPKLLTFPFETVSIGVLQDFIQEWQSPNFHILQAQPFAWLLILTLGVLGAAGIGLALSDFLLLAVFGFLGLLAARNIPLFALVAAIVLSRHAAAWLPSLGKKLAFKKRKTARPAPWLAWANAAIVLVLALAAVARAATLYPAEANLDAAKAMLPVGAVDYLKTHRPPGNLFNSYNFGGYLIWHLREYPVYIDGRTDLYDDGLLEEWVDTVSAKDGWQDTLDRWQIRLVLLEPTWQLAKLLEATEGWRLLYKDEVSVLYGR